MAGERILVVEDEPAVALSLVAGLEAAGFRVRHAASGQAALDLARAEPPDCLLLDLRLPDLHGFDVCRRLRQPEPPREAWSGPIIMLTALGDEVDRIVGLEIGADDYLTKPCSLRELIARIRAVLRRVQHTAPGPGQATRLCYGALTIDLARQIVLREGRPVTLTTTEFRLLAELARHPGHVFSRQDLLESVWSHAAFAGDERTVDVHVSHLRHKLEDDPARPRHLVTLRGVGYKFQA